MINGFITSIVKKRNPHFSLDNHLTISDLYSFFIRQSLAVIRGQLCWLYGRKPQLMLRAQGVTFEYLPRIKWGKFLKLGKQVHLSGLGTQGLVLGDNVSIGDYSKVVVSTALNNIGKGITIGNNVGMGEYAYLGGAGGLTIGENCIIGQYFSCHPENHVYDDPKTLTRLQGVSRKGIRIGANCWIGSKVTILDGAEIGHGCVIAAGAVVNGTFPDFSVIGGVPARILKNRNQQVTLITNQN